MKTHVEKGVVTESSDKNVKVTVTPSNPLQCDTCGASLGYCMASGGGAKERIMTLPAEPDLKAEHLVEVEITEPNPNLVVLLMVGLPLVFGLLGALGGVLASRMFGTRLPTTVLVGVGLGLFASFSVIQRMEIFWERRKVFHFRIVKQPGSVSIRTS